VRSRGCGPHRQFLADSVAEFGFVSISATGLISVFSFFESAPLPAISAAEQMINGFLIFDSDLARHSSIVVDDFPGSKLKKDKAMVRRFG
jgi:hypothetical protein